MRQNTVQPWTLSLPTLIVHVNRLGLSRVAISDKIVTSYYLTLVASWYQGRLKRIAAVHAKPIANLFPPSSYRNFSQKPNARYCSQQFLKIVRIASLPPDILNKTIVLNSNNNFRLAQFINIFVRIQLDFN